MNDQTPKPWSQSTTVWGNALAIVLGILPLIGVDLTDFQPETWVDQVILVVGGLLNLVNRFRTTRPIIL